MLQGRLIITDLPNAQHCRGKKTISGVFDVKHERDQNYTGGKEEGSFGVHFLSLCWHCFLLLLCLALWVCVKKKKKLLKQDSSHIRQAVGGCLSFNSTVLDVKHLFPSLLWKIFCGRLFFLSFLKGFMSRIGCWSSFDWLRNHKLFMNCYFGMRTILNVLLTSSCTVVSLKRKKKQAKPTFFDLIPTHSTITSNTPTRVCAIS